MPAPVITSFEGKQKSGAQQVWQMSRRAIHDVVNPSAYPAHASEASASRPFTRGPRSWRARSFLANTDRLLTHWAEACIQCAQKPPSLSSVREWTLHDCWPTYVKSLNTEPKAT